MSFSHHRTSFTRLAGVQVSIHTLATMTLQKILDELLGPIRSAALLQQVVVHPEMLAVNATRVVPRALLAQALNMALFEDLLQRVPLAAQRVQELTARGESIFFDHGALRTVAMSYASGLPAGFAAFARLLQPLGYEVASLYPLPKIAMTGRAFVHRDYPQHIAQFFVSELHLQSFSTQFAEAVERVLGSQPDPVTPATAALLAELEMTQQLSFSAAVTLLRQLLPCFSRQHGAVALRDYQLLLQESAEMAWIATEGHTFNHITERVGNIVQVADEQRALGRPLKEHIEVSSSGRVKQTSFFAAKVLREFVQPDGSMISRSVPGSFYEFIERAPMPGAAAQESQLDLGFDSGNAQGIFRMTAAA
jgi:hypothetical protein